MPARPFRVRNRVVRREVRRPAPSGIRSIVPVERRPASYGSNRAKQAAVIW
jgi:hypothetical protein